MKDTIKRVLTENFSEYSNKLQGYVNFNILTEKLNYIFGDRRFTVKVLASTTNTSSFTFKYRKQKFYAYKNNNGWFVELDNRW